MKMIKERERIRAARYVPGRRFEEGLEMTLANLPKRKRRRSVQEKVAIASTAAAAFVLFCVFVAPPIVRAASALIERVFGARIQQIDTYEAMDDDEKLAREIAEAEMYSRRHDVGESVEFEGVTVTLTGLSMRSNAAYDNSRTDGYVSMRLEYSALPPFDPNWMDFTLSFGGADYPAELGDGGTEYRKMNLRAITEDDWFGEDFNWWSNSSMNDGVPTTSLLFPVDDWKLQEPTEMTLKGAIDGKSYEIPFTFDPGLAHEEAVTEAERAVKLYGEWNEEKKQELEQFAGSAAQIGLTGTVSGVDYVLSELVFMDGMLNVSASFSGVPEPDAEQLAENPWLADPRYIGYMYCVSDVYTDGYPAVSMNNDSEPLGNGVFTSVKYTMLGRDPEALPAESLICVQLEMGYEEELVPLAFRYNWAERRVTLPEGGEQMRSWIAQADALRDELAAHVPWQTLYDLKPLNLTQTLNGLTVTLTQVEINKSYGMEVYYTLKRDKKYKNTRIGDRHYWEDEAGEVHDADPAATLNGLPTEFMSTTSQNGIPKQAQFSLPLHATQIGSNTKVIVTLPFQMDNRKGKAVYRETFEFEFTLDRESMKTEEIWESPFDKQQ